MDVARSGSEWLEDNVRDASDVDCSRSTRLPDKSAQNMIASRTPVTFGVSRPVARSSVALSIARCVSSVSQPHPCLFRRLHRSVTAAWASGTVSAAMKVHSLVLAEAERLNLEADTDPTDPKSISQTRSSSTC